MNVVFAIPATLPVIPAPNLVIPAKAGIEAHAKRAVNPQALDSRLPGDDAA